MPFFRKLLYYLIGVGLGVLIVIFLFGDRDFGCSYFPNDRVLSDLRKKELSIPEEVEAKMATSGLDTTDIRVMLQEGKVNFDLVERGLDSCKSYWISLEKETAKPFSALSQNCDSVVTVLDVKR